MAFAIQDSVLWKYTEEQGVTDIVIPKGVTRIEAYAFEWCESLTSVAIPEGVTEIGERAFYNCISLTSVTLSEGVTRIGNSAFSGCLTLTDVTIPESVTSIEEYAFFGVPWLKNHPEDMVIVNGILLEYKGKDSAVVIPEGVKVIGERAFYSCKRLVSVKIPEGVTVIGDHAFEYCTSLTSVTIPEGVTSIGESAFRWCKLPTSMTIPESVTSIGLFAFGGTPWLRHDLDDMVVVNGILLKYKGEDTAAVIPEGVTSIADGAFRGCKGLTSVIIPEGVTRIGREAFFECRSLTSVTIPASVTRIGERAFYDCKSLTSVTLYGVTFAPAKRKDNDFFDAMEMLKTRNFSMKLNTGIKYAAAVGFWLKTGDASTEKFIRKSLSRIMAFLAASNNPQTIRKLLDSGKFITRKNIDKYITCAIEHTQNGGNIEIQMMLMHYKADVLGYKDPAAQFKL